MEDEGLDRILKQGEVMIRLLGRLVFKESDVRAMVTKGKRNPEGYIEGYNACDGTLGVTKIAEIIGVSIGTLSPILQSWAEIGIIYEVSGAKGTFYKKIFSL